MTIADEQIEQFARDGVLSLESAFVDAEVARLEQALPEITDPKGAGVVLDADGNIRMSHGAHLCSETFGKLVRHPRLVEAARRLLGGDVYVYQSRLNMKPPLGDSPTPGYPWHQDFSTWHFRDGLAEPSILTTFVFLDEITACNAPLLTIPGSHEQGVIRDSGGHMDNGRYEQARIAPENLFAMAQNGVAAHTGPAGTVLFMHGCVAHASSDNVSPLRRAMFSIVYCAVGNVPAAESTPERYAARSFAPIEPLADDCLA